MWFKALYVWPRNPQNLRSNEPRTRISDVFMSLLKYNTITFRLDVLKPKELKIAID